MVADVIDVVAEFAIPRSAVWDLLLEPQTYPRVFPGIGACEPLESVDGNAMMRVRVGTARRGIRTHSVRIVVGRIRDGFELQCPAIGSFASVRLTGDEERTKIVVTYFAANRVHPTVAEASNAAVTEWTRAGLGRVKDLIRGARTSVVVNGENSPLRRHTEVTKQIVTAGVAVTYRLDRGIRQLRRLAEWGFNLEGGYAAAAAFCPERIAVVDAEGVRTFGEMHARTHALAAAMSATGLGPGDAIGLLARNHRGMVELMVAAGKLGVDVALLNTGLPTRRIEEVVQRDKLTALFVDAEFDHLVRYLHSDIARYAVDIRPPGTGPTSIEELIAQGHERFPKPTHSGKLIVLTSGTSGTPKGARRPHPKGFGTVAALLSRIPLRANDTMLIPAPLFHTWGLAALQMSTALRATVVLPSQFDAEDCLRLIAEHRVTTFIAVPIMVHRILELPAHIRERYDTSSLRVVASCGAPLTANTVLRFMDEYGDILYNVYGSTEVSWATVADPADLRTSPTTAGRPPLGTRVAVLGPDHQPLPVGATGHIFVGNHMLFDGYVNSAPPDEADGMLDTGDLGYLDATGKLFIDGRDDEMIISGGENVFPRPVEEALAYLPQVSEVAVVGVPDQEFGQRLAAFVVKREGSGLDSDMVRNYIKHRLSRFSVPRDVTFLSALPRGETGKILKRLLIGPSAGDPSAIGSALPGPS
ncbi:AMP-binding protein [Nocardia arizonensis]|uniref:AMP-binding protein n=1 Tax=Nocardia arizonensis TaxID=1141647 RepID=UPI0006D04CDA|nr:AMP-binding protein [Nocardia arizonensis]